jgi:hypothetical protein
MRSGMVTPVSQHNFQPGCHRPSVHTEPICGACREYSHGRIHTDRPAGADRSRSSGGIFLGARPDQRQRCRPGRENPCCLRCDNKSRLVRPGCNRRIYTGRRRSCSVDRANERSAKRYLHRGVRRLDPFDRLQQLKQLSAWLVIAAAFAASSNSSRSSLFIGLSFSFKHTSAPRALPRKTAQKIAF